MMERGIHVKMSDKDLQLIKENTADFIAFSYYSSICTAHDTEGLQITKANRTIVFIINIYRQMNGAGKLIQLGCDLF